MNFVRCWGSINRKGKSWWKSRTKFFNQATIATKNTYKKNLNLQINRKCAAESKRITSSCQSTTAEVEAEVVANNRVAAASHRAVACQCVFTHAAAVDVATVAQWCRSDRSVAAAKLLLNKSVSNSLNTQQERRQRHHCDLTIRRFRFSLS